MTTFAGITTTETPEGLKLFDSDAVEAMRHVRTESRC